MNAFKFTERDSMKEAQSDVDNNPKMISSMGIIYRTPEGKFVGIAEYGGSPNWCAIERNWRVVSSRVLKGVGQSEWKAYEG
jgi:hypothetical protein